MKNQTISGWLTLIANLGILTGVLLVVVELSQIRELMTAQVRNDFTTTVMNRNDAAASDPVMIDLMMRGKDGNNLDANEDLRYRLRTSGTFQQWANTHFQYQLGLFSEQEFQSYRNSWTTIARASNGFARVWCGSRNSAAADFRAEMDAIFGEDACK